MQDNTIADSPMVELLTSMQHMLEQARVRSGGIGSSSPLHQLVIIVADGRFHEKENLQRVVAVRCDSRCCLLGSCHAVPHAKPCSNGHPCCCFRDGFMPSMAWTGAYRLIVRQGASVCVCDGAGDFCSPQLLSACCYWWSYATLVVTWWTKADGRVQHV